MKIGIMTFSRTHNYGSLLQSYALQQVLKDKFNLESEFINYSNDIQREMYALYHKNNSLKNIVKNTKYLLGKKSIVKHFNDFEDFFNEYLVSSKEDYRYGDKIDYSQYSKIIAGSDQVWNVEAYDYDDYYFLKFAEKIDKIGYACSLGGTNLLKKSSDVNNIKNYLSDFKSISVREKNSKTWVQNLCTQNVEICLDPTLLLTKNEWESKFKEKRLIEEKYIYYYGFKYEKEMNRKVAELGQKLNLPVYCLDAKKYYLYDLHKYGFKLAPMGGPRAFINMTQNCEVEVTTSFHGTVFATIFEKPFFYLRKCKEDMDDDRASFLLEQLGLSKQDCPFEKIVENSDDLFNIDYDNSRELVKRLRQKSLKFIEDNIQK